MTTPTTHPLAVTCPNCGNLHSMTARIGVGVLPLRYFNPYGGDWAECGDSYASLGARLWVCDDCGLFADDDDLTHPDSAAYLGHALPTEADCIDPD